MMKASAVAHHANKFEKTHGQVDDTYFCRTEMLEDESIFEQPKVPFFVPDREPDFEIVGYLRRWCLVPRNKVGNYYLHNILGADEPFYHDHPWPFRSIILSGGYQEATPEGFKLTKRWHLEGQTRVMDATTPHYISEVLPDTWTLIITGPVQRDWGFYGTRGDWVKHDQFKEGRRDLEVICRNGYNDGD